MMIFQTISMLYNLYNLKQRRQTMKKSRMSNSTVGREGVSKVSGLSR